MKNLLLILILLISILEISNPVYADESNIPTQIIKGNVTNITNLQPVVGATISIIDTKYGNYSKKDGSFKIQNVPVGRYVLKASAVGFESRILNIVLTSGKELSLNIQLNESVVKMEEITVTASKGNFVPINEAVSVSATEFSVDDAQRFAGSRMDPARMAQNFAGVLGANDQRNDIIIRGGSPTELLWRIDGMDVPNPNHFATQGATGGPVSAINTMLLDNSDFLTGAFPVEYPDRMSGVFDLRTRQGNKDKYEYYGQFGFNGFELGAEGPIAPQIGSFLASYRYSFLGLLDAMGIDFGFAGIPKYQDATIRTDLLVSDNHRISLTGLWGTSNINIKESDKDDAATGDQDIINGTDFLAIGINWNYLVSEKILINTLISTNYNKYQTSLDSLTVGSDNIKSFNKWYNAENSEGYYNIKSTLNYSPDVRNTFKFGFESRFRYFNFSEERFTNNDDGSLYKLSSSGNSTQLIGFLNWNHRFSDDFSFNAGLLTQYLELSNYTTIEPRAGISYRFAENHTLSAGLGIYRQSLPLITFESSAKENNLDFMQSIHYVLGYSAQISEVAIIKIETYYKDISKAPINGKVKNSFSFLNSGANFGKVFTNDELVSEGLGRAYGAEFSLIKHFTNGYYVNATASFVRQEYRGSDEIWREGAYDNQYIFNLLAGYEMVISNDLTIEISGKWCYAGGAPYTPVDKIKSAQYNQTFYLEDKAFSERNPDYSRLDFRIDFRQNFSNMSIISYISIENVINQENVLMRIWDNKNRDVKTINQIGLFPIGGIRIEF